MITLAAVAAAATFTEHLLYSRCYWKRVTNICEAPSHFIMNHM